jgi:hypothetical protein
MMHRGIAYQCEAPLHHVQAAERRHRRRLVLAVLLVRVRRRLRCMKIEAPWLANGGHSASVKHRPGLTAAGL